MVFHVGAIGIVFCSSSFALIPPACISAPSGKFFLISDVDRHGFRVCCLCCPSCPNHCHTSVSFVCLSSLESGVCFAHLSATLQHPVIGKCASPAVLHFLSSIPMTTCISYFGCCFQNDVLYWIQHSREQD